MNTSFRSLLPTVAGLFALCAVVHGLRAQSVYTTPYTFSTVAGAVGSVGANDGTGSAARFQAPQSVAVDGSGNIFVADFYNQTIRKVTAGGIVTTLAGTAGSAGIDDGTGSAARFSGPSGVAVDSSGNVYVADYFNHTIRKITAGGVVSTLAGTAGSPGITDATGSAARFNFPAAVAVDSAGNLYVADSGNHTIRKVTSGGVVTTLAGAAGSSGSANGTGSFARFNTPYGIAVDASGSNIYVGDTMNHTIRVVTSGGTVTTLAGTAGTAGSADGTGTAALFQHPEGVTVDAAANVYVADYANHTVRKINSSGVVTTLAGLGGSFGSADGTGSAARFYFPSGISVDGSSGTVYVADNQNFTIRKVTSSGAVTTLAGKPPYGFADGTGSAAGFNAPAGVAADSSGTVYVSDTYNHSIRKISAGGVVTTLAGLSGTLGSADGTGSAARFDLPEGLAVDASGNVYVADYGNDTIRKITAGGVVTTLAGTPGSSGSTDATGSAARFNNPRGVAVDSAGNVYVADYGNHTIRKITPGGVVTTLAGTAGSVGSTDATGSAARFAFPHDVAVDADGNVYVVDTANCTIRMITPGGVVTTLAGTVGAFGSADGTGSAARFDNPAGVAVTASGTVFVADFANNTIRKITSGGVVTTVAGLSGTSGASDGVGSEARFNLPQSIAVSGGTLYVADTNSHEIRSGFASPDAISYGSTTFPSSVITGGAVSFTYNVTNTGTQAWGPNHYLAVWLAGGSYVTFPSLDGTASGAGKVASGSFTAPSAPGTYTYYVQALDNASGFFGPQVPLTLTVTATPDAVSYGATTFPASVVPGGAVSFSYSVTNDGTQAWGSNHYLAVWLSGGSYVTFPSLNGTAPGAVKVATGSFFAPSTPGTYTYYVQALDNAVGFFGPQIPLMLTVTNLPDAINYGTSTFPSSVTPSGPISFVYNVTNTGTQAWGSNHYLAVWLSGGSYVTFPSLNGTAPGADKAASGSFFAPSTPGTYTYYVQALDNAVGFFGPQIQLTVTVAAVPNAISYGSTTFPSSVSAGGAVTFVYNVTNMGTQAWGPNHYLAIWEASGPYVSFPSLNGTAVGAGIAASGSFTAPSTPGTYTYYVQALDNDSGFFGPQITLTLVVH